MPSRGPSPKSRGGRSRRPSAGSASLHLLLPHFRSSAIAGDGDESVVEAGPLDRQSLDPCATVDQPLEQWLGPVLRKLEHPFVAFAPCAVGNVSAPWAVGCTGPKPNDRSKPCAGLVDAPVECDAALGDDRDALAEALGMRDDVGRKEDGHAGAGFAADQLLEPRLVDRIEAGEGLV